MKKSIKSVICLVSFIVCLIVLAIGVDVGSKGWTTASSIGLAVVGIYVFFSLLIGMWED